MRLSKLETSDAIKRLSDGKPVYINRLSPECLTLGGNPNQKDRPELRINNVPWFIDAGYFITLTFYERISYTSDELLSALYDGKKLIFPKSGLTYWYSNSELHNNNEELAEGLNPLTTLQEMVERIIDRPQAINIVTEN